MPPFIYHPDKSIDVNRKTMEYLDNNPEVKAKIQKVTWLYHSLHNVIPVTTESFWSGHNFPYNESWEEMQISFNLVCFGLYKQAMVSMRSVLELGLLSVYYNINDEGHIAVKKWLSSDDSKEADTPRNQKVWKILIEHENIKRFQSHIDLKQRFFDLGFLHNYVHTKGHKFSNKLGILKSNFQTFEEKSILFWLDTLEEIVVIILTLHILKYPTALMEYDFGKKFGIDVPCFSHLQSHEIENLKEFLPKDFFELLTVITSSHPETIDFLNWLESLPDMTEEDVENQICEMDKGDIERQGINEYKKNQLMLYGVNNFNELSAKVQKRIDKLEKWAIENNFLESKFKTKIKAGNKS